MTGCEVLLVFILTPVLFAASVKAMHWMDEEFVRRLDEQEKEEEREITQ